MKSLEEKPLSINQDLKETLNDLLKFPLIEAMAGRRSRRFCMGAEIPDGVLAFKSKQKPMPLSEIEQLLVLSYMGGVTGWHFAIMRHARYAPKLSNYCGSPVGRTFPSSAGFITSELFYTDDNGLRLTSMSASIGSGFFGGLPIGYALKKVIKMLAIVVGLKINSVIFSRLV
jgi:hypothetical protein